MNTVEKPDNRFFGSCALTGTGAETVYDTTVTIAYTINGKIYSKAAVADGVTPTTDGNTGLAFNAVLRDRICALVWAVDSSDAVTLYQGGIQEMDGTADTPKTYPQFPSIPDTVTPFAYTIYKTTGTAAAAGLKPGTDNWNATGLTATHVNISTLPNRPQIS